MKDPFSKHIRRFVAWPDVQGFQQELEQRSLIGISDLSLVQIHDRVSELERYESRFGFVFCGEKQWLLTVGSNGQIGPYEVWVHSQFEDVIFAGQGLTRKDEDKLGVCWQGYSEDLSYFVAFDELKHPSIKMDNLLLTVPGTETGPASDHLIVAFQIMHNLCYYLHHAGQKMSKISEDLFLDEIVVGPEKGFWTMDLINEYGSVGAVNFSGQGIV
jgi:hypothetical protein